MKLGTLFLTFCVLVALAYGQKGNCGPNEEDGCVPCPCPERTCQVPNPKCPDLVCVQVCLPFCVCKPGFLRDAKTKKCVPIRSCPRRGY
ncbi:chymotrypsin inhibitor Ani s 6-like [Diabrotica virgifera virgifera]|uniref:Chymotrypsin inhibitor Ani s 6-like n=1 Tax=Diabrotica virgifera virgifera TaxID=50390 RepID=A0A6P7GDD4_DIAVI|nr:chymotrypsin inhibitor Ani s 6-like [Diabrotica virgifera virgifera]